jgi:hypothetical protein
VVLCNRQRFNVARLGAIDPTLLPYSWFLDYIIHGAYEHQWPDSHFDYLMDIASLVDRNSTRHARNRWLIEK